jgi:hypothetical protein
MYLQTNDQFHEAMAQEQALAGFNPLKAIGRALGGAGRAIVGTLIPGGQVVSKVLDVAAKSPAGSGPAIAQAINTAIAPPAPTPAPAPVPTDRGQAGMRQRRPRAAADGGGTDAMLAKLMAATQPSVMTPAGGPTISVSSPGAPAPYLPPTSAAGELPSWAIPAGIAGLAAVFLLSQKGSRR